MYWDCLGFPKKIWGLGPHPHGTWDPPNTSFWGHLGGPGVHEGGVPRPQFFLGSLGSPNTYIIKRLDGWSISFIDFLSQM